MSSTINSSLSLFQLQMSTQDARLVQNCVSNLGGGAQGGGPLKSLNDLFNSVINGNGGAPTSAPTSPTAPTGPATGPGQAPGGGTLRSINDVFNMVINGSPASTPTPCPCQPKPADCAHPAGSLKTDDKGVITTPGGYKIEQLGQFDWKISGPDGKETKIWGDPHVAEGDGGKWDFKRDSTFVLGDGTRINVSTKPYGKDMTVTGGLEVISGNDRVQVTDIDKGKGKVGQVTQDGYAHANSFSGKDTFVMGKETDDWSFQGKEIVGSNNGGESFQLGKDLPAGAPTSTKPQQAPQTGNLDRLLNVFRAMSKVFDAMRNFVDVLTKRNGQNPASAPGTQGNWLDRRQAHLGGTFEKIGRMMDTFFALQNLTRSVQPHRNHFLA